MRKHGSCLLITSFFFFLSEIRIKCEEEKEFCRFHKRWECLKFMFWGFERESGKDSVDVGGHFNVRPTSRCVCVPPATLHRLGFTRNGIVLGEYNGWRYRHGCLQKSYTNSHQCPTTLSVSRNNTCCQLFTQSTHNLSSEGFPMACVPGRPKCWDVSTPGVAFNQ